MKTASTAIELIQPAKAQSRPASSNEGGGFASAFAREMGQPRGVDANDATPKGEPASGRVTSAGTGADGVDEHDGSEATAAGSVDDAGETAAGAATESGASGKELPPAAAKVGWTVVGGRVVPLSAGAEPVAEGSASVAGDEAAAAASAVATVAAGGEPAVEDAAASKGQGGSGDGRAVADHTRVARLQETGGEPRSSDPVPAQADSDARGVPALGAAATEGGDPPAVSRPADAVPSAHGRDRHPAEPVQQASERSAAVAGVKTNPAPSGTAAHGSAGEQSGSRQGDEQGAREKLTFRELAGRMTGGDKAADVGQSRTAAVEMAARLPEPPRSTAPTATPVTHPHAVSAPPATVTAPAPVVAVSTPLHNHAAWNQAFGERVAWMARGGLREAQIQINPRELGPVEIRLSLNNDQVNIQFTAQHAATRDAIEQALPRLRELLGDSGLQLGQANVGDFAARGQNGAQQQQGNGHHAGRGATEALDAAGEAEIHEGQIAVGDDGAVDYYA